MSDTWPEWQPIETAPKDGGQILVGLAVYGSDDHPTHAKRLIRWEFGIAETCDGHPFLEYDSVWSDTDWTHWIPLPPAPKEPINDD